MEKNSAKTNTDKKSKGENWVKRASETSNALDLEKGVFTLNDPHAIALSLKQSAEKSTRRKRPPFASAMAMLNFYLNRAGKALPEPQRKILNQAKQELRDLYGVSRRSKQ